MRGKSIGQPSRTVAWLCVKNPNFCAVSKNYLENPFPKLSPTLRGFEKCILSEENAVLSSQDAFEELGFKSYGWGRDGGELSKGRRRGRGCSFECIFPSSK